MALSKVGVLIMTLAEALSKRVNELLESNKITQYQLFKLSGVPQTTISDVRNMKMAL